MWFAKYHPEQVPSAVERYVKEINRVTGVLEGYLAQQKQKAGTEGDGPWLVGNKFSYADLAFIPWQLAIAMALPNAKERYNVDDYPHVKQWLEKMTSRETTKAVVASYYG